MINSLTEKPYYWLLGATFLLLIALWRTNISFAILPGFHISEYTMLMLALIGAAIYLPIISNIYLILKINGKVLNASLTFLHVLFTFIPISIVATVRIFNLDMEIWSGAIVNIEMWVELIVVLVFLFAQLIFIINILISFIRKNKNVPFIS